MKTKSQQRFETKQINSISVKTVIGLLTKHFKELEEIDNKIFQIEQIEEDFGNESYSESRYGFKLYCEEFNCIVLHITETEDDEDWGQAEWSESWSCVDMHTYKTINTNVIKNKLYKILEL